MSSHLSNQIGLGIQPPGGINFNTSLEGVDVPGTTYNQGAFAENPGTQVAKQKFYDKIQNNLHSGNQGLITTNDQDVNVNPYMNNNGSAIITLTKDDDPNYNHVLWDGDKAASGEWGETYGFNPNKFRSYVAVGTEEELYNEIKQMYIAEGRYRTKTEEGFNYPTFLEIPKDNINNNIAPVKEEQDATTNWDLKFGKVDKIIKKLSLRNLVYPIDADFGNTQDYMQINQFTYRPPNKDIFFPKSAAVKTEAKTNPSQLLGQGVPLGTPREEFLGLVKLPMPNNLTDSNNVSWGADQLNALTAAVSSAVFGQGQMIAQKIGDTLGSDKFDEANFFQKIIQLLQTGGNIVGTSLDQGKTELNAIIKDLTTKGSNLNVMTQAIAGSALLNIGQFGLTPETVLGRGQGVVPNSNIALLFNSPTLREFTFSWKMTPRSREEASRVRNIIRFFKQGMAPKKGINTATGAASFFLGTPNVFDIIFKTTRDKYDILNENDSVLRIKTCACTGAAVNYTPDGMWNAYEKGQPVAVTLSLRFSELEPIFDTDYDDNEFNYSENRPDLRPVPIDAIGY